MSEHSLLKPIKSSAQKTVKREPVHIIIVEDDQAHAELIERGLLSAKKNYRLSVAATLRDAKRLLASDPPHLMILDWLLPDGKGNELLPEKPEDICFPVIVLTSHGDEALAEDLIRHGAADYIVKSKLVFEDLPHIVERTIRNWKIHQEQRKLEKELTIQISTLQTLINNPVDSIALLDKNGIILDLNTTLADRLGMNASDAIGKNAYELIPEPLARTRRSRIVKVFRTGVAARFEDERDGRWFDNFIQPVVDGAGVVSKVIVNARDITENRKAEAELRFLVENVEDIIWQTTPDLRFTYLSPATQKLTGYSVDEMIGKPLSSFLTEQSVMKARERLLVRKKESETREKSLAVVVEVEMLKKGGETIWLEVSSKPVINPDGTIIGFQGISRDITARRHAEEALRESEELYRGVFENTGTATVIIEEDTTISFANDEFCRLSGCRKEEIEGRKQWTEFVVPEDLDRMLTQHRFRRKQLQEAIRHYEFRFITKANQIRDIYLSVDVIRGTKRSVASLLDITERKAAENLLRESEKKFHDTVLNLDEAFYSCTLEGILLEHNPAFNRIAGVDSGQDLRGTHLPDFWQIAHDRQKYLEELVNTGFVRNFLVGVKKHDGKKLVVMANSHLVRDEKDLPVRIEGTFLDITARNQVEESLQESEERYRNVVEDQTEFICRFTPDGRITFVNDAYCRYFSLDKSQCIAKFHSVMLLPEDARRMKPYLASLTKENPVAHIEHRIIMPSGEIRWQRWSDRAIFDKDGLLVEYQSVGRDTTEKNKAEVALRDSEMRYRSVIENAAEGIVVVQDGIVQYANTRALEMVDLSPEEIGNQQFTGFIHPEDQAFVFDRYQRRIRGENVPQNYDFRIVGKSGQTTWVQVSAVQISWNNLMASLNFLTDITDRKLMEAEIQSLNRVLEQRVVERTEQLNVMLGEKELLLREVHHRVKNNLQIVASLFNLQSRYIVDQKALEAIRESQNRVRAMALVHERLYRSENAASVDMKEYLTYLGGQVFHFYGVKPSQITLSLTMPEIGLDVDTVIPLGLIVNELLSNSLKHAFPNGRKGTISVLGECGDQEISLVFSDDGVGFPPGLDWKNSPSLGLRLVISLVRQLNGKIELDPSPGTTFRITVTRLQHKKRDETGSLL